MNAAITQLFAKLWQHYLHKTPSAAKIHSLLSQSYTLINDHVAFRTFDCFGIEAIAQHFIALGYQAKGEYQFKAKKLYAKHYEHTDKQIAKVFISELQVAKLSLPCQQIIARLAAADARAAQHQLKTGWICVK